MPSRTMNATRERILDVAREVLGRNPEAGMGEIAVAAGVVRRTVYGHFPTRGDLVRTLAEQAAGEIAAVLASADVSGAADLAWAEFVAHLWPLTHRYRVLIALRRGEFGAEIHALLGPMERDLSALVERGQRSGTFGRHLPADVLSRLAYTSVFTIAEDDVAGTLGAPAATITSLLLLGVPEGRAATLAEQRG